MSWGAAKQGPELDPELARMVAPWLESDFVERHVAWARAAVTVQSAYDHWQASRGRHEPVTFAAYHAALDREEHAAAMLREAVARISAAQRRARRRSG